jgi:uncharacterized protein YbjT (DUF2867 family)
MTVDALAARGYQVSIVVRHRGPLGQRMRSRAEMLRRRGLLGDEDVEDILVVRAQWPGGRDERELADGQPTAEPVF